MFYVIFSVFAKNRSIYARYLDQYFSKSNEVFARSGRIKCLESRVSFVCREGMRCSVDVKKRKFGIRFVPQGQEHKRGLGVEQ